MRARPGFVLAAAIACLVVMGVMVAATLFAGNQEARATSSQILDQQAFAYAERAAMLTVGSWSCAECDSMAVGGVIIRSGGNEPPLESTVYITRLDSALYLVVAEGRMTIGGGDRISRRVSVAVRLARDSSGTLQARRLGAHSWAGVYRM